MTVLLFTLLSLLTVDPRPCAAVESELTVTSGLAQALIEIFPSKAEPVVKQAVADGLVKALHDESIDANEVLCVRDYTQLCPSGWTDAGDASTCQAPLDYSGKCKPKVAFGGLTSQQKRQQASNCGASFACLDACSEDASAACPQGWIQDINGDCLAPVGYSGRCVLRKSFSGMKPTEKKAWVQACDLSWPCRKAGLDFRDVDRTRTKGSLNGDCVMNFSQACPENFQLHGSSCIAQSEGSAGLCGLELSSNFNHAEKAAYARACRTPWPCLS